MHAKPVSPQGFQAKVSAEKSPGEPPGLLLTTVACTRPGLSSGDLGVCPKIIVVGVLARARKHPRHFPG